MRIDFFFVRAIEIRVIRQRIGANELSESSLMTRGAPDLRFTPGLPLSVSNDVATPLLGEEHIILRYRLQAYIRWVTNPIFKKAWLWETLGD